MPKVSRESAQTDDFGVVEDRHADIDGHTISFVTMRVEMDHTAVLKGLPNDRCQCPHWGYVFKGRITYRFADHNEVHEAGDAFYVPADHNPIVEAGTEWLQFSPAEELALTSAAIMKNMQAMQPAP